MNNKAFSDWFDSYPNGEPSYQETFEAGQDSALAQPEQSEPPYGSKRAAAMAVYTPPFKYKYGYIYDSQNLMVADNDGVEGAVAARVRGWGRLGYLPNGAELQDEIGQMMADALTALYTAPPPRELSESEVVDIAKRCNILDDTELLDSNQWRQDTLRELQAFARAVLAEARSKTP